jgi:hypothetical protein
MRSRPIIVGLGACVLFASAAVAADCPKEEAKFANELTKMVGKCKTGDTDCQARALQKCQEELGKHGCDPSRCDACPDDADKMLPGVCGCGSFEMFNTNGAGCTFCARNLPGCGFSCVGSPLSICEPLPDCCDESPCASGCPGETSLECTVNTCDCEPEGCCSTVCPVDETCDKEEGKRARELLGALRHCKDDPACEERVLGRCAEKLERRGCGSSVCDEAAAAAKRCELEEAKQANELTHALGKCKPGDQRCEMEALEHCTEKVEKQGCDTGACDACPDDPDKTLPGLCGCGYSEMSNTNAEGCTFCGLRAPACEFVCLGPPACLCGGNPGCCEENPCCDDCPAPRPPACDVSTCGCEPDTCCFTLCPQ